MKTETTRSLVAQSTALTEDQLREIAPSLFTAHGGARTSARFRPIATIDAVRELDRLGYVPTGVKSSGKDHLHGRHAVRFAAKSGGLAGDRFEIVITNANNGAAAFRVDIGYYRQVCSNGLIAFDPQAEGGRVVHRSDDVLDRMLAAVARVSAAEDATARQIERWREIEMDDAQAVRLLAAPLRDVRFGRGAGPDARALLAPRRWQDEGVDLWTRMNVIQENLLTGQVPYVLPANDVRRARAEWSRPIQAVVTSRRLNLRIWNQAVLAEKQLTAAAA